MNSFIKAIKAVINALMTLILIVGILFIVLYVIGIEPFVVESGSMQPTIQTGSLSFINKHASYKNIKENDIIAFKSSTGSKITHRAVKVTDSGIETKGDSNINSDGITTTESNYIGKNIFSIPKLGYVVKLLQTVTGKVILIIIIIIVLLSGVLLEDPKKRKKLKQE